jgi:hypothetical protein
MSSRNALYLSTKATFSEDHHLIASTLQTLIQYVFCVGLGLLSGLTSVALTISLTVVVQSVLFPVVIFTPSAIILTIIAAGLSLGFSWLFSRVTPRILPNLFGHLSERGLQIIFIFGVLASLLETLLFLR